MFPINPEAVYGVWCSLLLCVYWQDVAPNSGDRLKADTTARLREFAKNTDMGGPRRPMCLEMNAVNPASHSETVLDVARRIKLVAAHEMGHLPLYSKGNAHHAEMGQMGNGGQPPTDEPDVSFSAKSLRRFRGVWEWRQEK